MIIYKTIEEIELIRQSSLLVGAALSEAAKSIRPGISTISLDKLVHDFILDNQAVPSFLNYRGYPYSCCISVNDAVVHGFPGNYILQDGDIISIDVGVYKNGFHGDSAYTFALNGVSKNAIQLMHVTKQSLHIGIEKAIHGNRVGDISFAIQNCAEKQNGYGIVRELVGHGLGADLHESPEIPNYGKRGTGTKLREGMVIAIEPMINLGKKDIYTAEDGWTIKTKDGKVSAHYEHTVAIKKDKADILSSFVDVQTAEKLNANLFSDY